MYSNITIARGVGALFLVSTATYMLGTGMVDSLLSAPSYLTQLSANQAQLVTGVLLQFVNSAAVVAIGVLLFPVLSRQSQTIALGYAGTRMLECAFLAIGGISSLLLVGVSQHMLQAATPDAAAFSALGAVLVAGGHTMYLVAMCTLGLGSLPFCYVLYQTRLIPRPLAMLGLIGYAALLGGSVLELFGMNLNLIHNIPGGLFELLLPLWLIIKGFNQTAAAPVAAGFALKGSQ